MSEITLLWNEPNGNWGEMGSTSSCLGQSPISVIRKHNSSVSERYLVRYTNHVWVRDRLFRSGEKCMTMLKYIRKTSLTSHVAFMPFSWTDAWFCCVCSEQWSLALQTPSAHSVPLFSPALYALLWNSSEDFIIIICIGQSLQALTIMNLPVW